MAEQAEAMRATVASMLRGIERYNPENISTLERYVELQARENTYDLEANLALLKLYQFNPGTYQSTVACQILMKALTNLPHTDFVLCKCLLGQDQISGIKDFSDSICKYVCHVITITYQHIEKPVLAQLLGNVDETSLQAWMNKYGWKENEDGYVFIANQEETVKTKNITEKIEFDSVAGIMAACR
ncbi:eukaryotic translation initiation factor 3 subunit K isoform X2 [Panulirus ornatus]|uniref:eukaryotic translation initiation factor 3 subunit K isoform X2 n=1 Tax=Panulirus ornatus TaxID=150431 RepID=UPI003A89B3A9